MPALRFKLPGADGNPIVTYNGSHLSYAQNKLLFLTYFNHISNWVDTPAYGDPYTIGGRTTQLSNTQITFNGTSYPGLRYQGLNNNSEPPVTIPFDNILPIDTFTVDFIGALRCTNGWGYISITHDPGDPCIGGNLWSSGRGIGIFGHTSRSYEYINPSYRRIGYNDYYVYVALQNEVPFHGALVVEKLPSGQYKQRIYLNGELACILSLAESQLTDPYLWFNANYRLSSGGNYTEIAQLAVHAGNLSINDGMNFPVPEQPYMPIR